jgi:anti-anti-sigma factor
MLHTRVESGETPVIFLKGDVDLDSAETLRWVVGDVTRGVTEVILDFADVTFIDSSGTGLVVRMTLDLQSRGIKLRLRNISPPVADVFAMLKVRQLVGDDAFVDPPGDDQPPTVQGDATAPPRAG